MTFQANGVLPASFVFKFFFRFSTTGDKYKLSTQRGGYVLVPDGKTPEN